MTPQENTTIVQNTYAAFKRGDFDALFANYAPDVDWQVFGPDSMPTAGRWRGVDGLKQFFGALDQAMAVTSFETREFIAQDDRVVVLGDYAWTVKPTGKPFASHFAHVVTLRDGKIATFREYTDTAAAVAAFAS